MAPIGKESVDKIRRDHEHMLQLIERIQSLCDQRDKIDVCTGCHSSQQSVCHSNVEQLIRAFVEATLKHNLIESMFMEGIVPSAHRMAHNKAHMEIAQQLKEIRVVFSKDGDGIHAIEGVDRVQKTLLAHFIEYDQQLETLLTPALANS